MLQIGTLNNALQKRLIRPLYAHTQATPWAATLDASLRNTDGSFRAPITGDNFYTMGARTANAFTLQGGLVPGTVMVKGPGEAMLVHNGAAAVVPRPFGLLANFVGGTLDDLKSNNEIGVWRGPDSAWELLYPAFDPTGLAALYSGALGGQPVLLAAGVDGRLVGFAEGGAGTRTVVAHLVEYTPAKITIDLKV